MTKNKGSLGTTVTFFLFSMFVIQKRFKTIIDKVFKLTVALENIHSLN